MTGTATDRGTGLPALVAISAVAALCACESPSLDTASTAEAPPPPGCCATDSWGPFLESRAQTFATQPAVPVAGGEIVPTVFGPLQGSFGKLYLFMLVRDGCLQGALSVASHEPMTRSAREAGTLGPGQRLYHVDLYLPGEHRSLGHGTAPPGYLQALALAREHLR